MELRISIFAVNGYTRAQGFAMNRKFNLLFLFLADKTGID